MKNVYAEVNQDAIPVVDGDIGGLAGFAVLAAVLVIGVLIWKKRSKR